MVPLCFPRSTGNSTDFRQKQEKLRKNKKQKKRKRFSFCISAAAQWFLTILCHSRHRSPSVKAASNLGLFVTRCTCKRLRTLLHPDLLLGSGLEDLKRWRLFSPPKSHHITHLSLLDSCLSFLAVPSNKNVSD